jgi:AcrR family transcriptional regulator
MAERDLIVGELKRALREHGLTYLAVARQLDLSLASVKRLFASGDFSLARAESICEMMGLTLGDILERARSRTAPVNQLTLAQEQEIVADPKLLFITWLVLSRASFEEIVRDYRFTDKEALGYFIKLDRLKVIELQPGNRVRLLVSRQFTWRVGGPVQKYIHQKLLREFFADHFSGPQDEFFFHGCPVSGEALAHLKRALQSAARECMEIVERDRSARASGQGAAFVLALRPWKYSGFAQFDREPGRGKGI